MNIDVKNTKPVVSICVITYNHVEYIRECLDSLLLQKTSFPYEICLGEDESTDGTREICIEYAEKHPDRIRLFLHSQSTPGREAFMAQGNYNYLETTKLCRGKYVAVCEGDDAWIDPLKLQKQFDIMEEDSGISLIHSDFDRIDVLSGQRISFVHREKGCVHSANPDPSIFMYDVLQGKYPIATCTCFMRTATVLRIFDEHNALFTELPMGDIPVWCELIQYGRFAYMDESLALYRVLEESASNTQSPEKKYTFVNNASNLGLMLIKKHNLPVKLIRANKVKNCNRYAMLSGDLVEIKELHAQSEFQFSVWESIIYTANHVKPLRRLFKFVFGLKYRRASAAEISLHAHIKGQRT